MTTLAEVYQDYSAPAGWGDKGTAHDYLPVYEREITKRNGVTLLEIGVYAGHSIAMWDAYLTDSTVIGIDIDLSHLEMAHHLVRHCDGTNPQAVAEQLPDVTFDYVIDDGSHTLQDQLLSLGVFLPLMNPDGRYFIEDIVGDEALAAITANLDALGYDYDVYDGRGPGRQPDEIMVTVRIPAGQ
jgi:hypothetical protein